MKPEFIIFYKDFCVSYLKKYIKYVLLYEFEKYCAVNCHKLLG